MDTHDFDAVVIGAGIAGATAAAALAADRTVALIEAEEAGRLSQHRPLRGDLDPELRPAGRARADRAVARASSNAPPAGFAERPLMRRRPVVFLAPPEQIAAAGRRCWPTGSACARPRLPRSTAMVPALRPGYAAAAAIEDGRVRPGRRRAAPGVPAPASRRAGGVLALRSRAGRIARSGGRMACRDQRRRGVPRPRRWSTPPAPGATRWRQIGRRRAARPGAEPAHRRDHRSRALRRGGLADDQRCRRTAGTPGRRRAPG